MRFGKLRICRAPRLPRAGVGGGKLAQSGLDLGMGGDCGIGHRLQPNQIALQLRKPVDLLKPQRRSAWRIPGVGAKAVPAPKIALDGDKPLPRLEDRVQRLPRLMADKPDLRQTPRQNRGGIHPQAQRLGPLGQGLRLVIGRQVHPARACVPANKGVQKVIRQSHAQRCLIPRFDRNLVQDLRARLRLTLDQPGKGGNLGPKRASLALG